MIHKNVESAVAELLAVGGNLQNSAREIANDATRILHKNIVNQVQNLGLVASTDFIKSITATQVVPLAVLGYNSTVQSLSDYADVIEEGRRPNSKFPPPDRILKWMTIRNLEPTMEGAYLISRKIARDGIKGKHPFEKGEEASIPAIVTAAEIEVAAALNNSKFNVVFNEAKSEFRVEVAS